MSSLIFIVIAFIVIGCAILSVGLKINDNGRKDNADEGDDMFTKTYSDVAGQMACPEAHMDKLGAVFKSLKNDIND